MDYRREGPLKTFTRGLCIALFVATATHAEDDSLSLAVPSILEDSGFMQYLVPRFSLKTGIRIDRLGEDEAADMRFGGEGTAVFTGLGQTWALAHEGDARAVRFEDWLTSEVGMRTIDSFAGEGGAQFSAAVAAETVEEETVFEGDAALGETLSMSLCGRCHVINHKNRMKGMGSTPSFALMRTFEDWQTRFATFHLLKPHPSFTQIDGVTEAFDPAAPPPIVPLDMTLDDLDAILAYVAGIEPADLGAPIQFQ
jgi:hypothetical protein